MDTTTDTIAAEAFGCDERVYLLTIGASTNESQWLTLKSNRSTCAKLAPLNAPTPHDALPLHLTTPLKDLDTGFCTLAIGEIWPHTSAESLRRRAGDVGGNLRDARLLSPLLPLRSFERGEQYLGSGAFDLLPVRVGSLTWATVVFMLPEWPPMPRL